MLTLSMTRAQSLKNKCMPTFTPQQRCMRSIFPESWQPGLCCILPLQGFTCLLVALYVAAVVYAQWLLCQSKHMISDFLQLGLYLRKMVPIVVHLPSNCCISFFLIDEQNSIAQMKHSLFIQSSANGHLDYFHIFAIIDCVAMNMSYGHPQLLICLIVDSRSQALSGSTDTKLGNSQFVEKWCLLLATRENHNNKNINRRSILGHRIQHFGVQCFYIAHGLWHANFCVTTHPKALFSIMQLNPVPSHKLIFCVRTSF